MADDRWAAPGAASALLAYCALLLGFFAIGIVTQQNDVVAGLWVTEALAIALPAVVAVRAAGLSDARYLGLRTPKLSQLAVALLLAGLNQPVVSFLTWAARSLSPPRWAEEFDALQRVLDAVFAQNAAAMLLTVSIAAPFGEELFFRGYALPALARSWGPTVAVLLTGAMFSVLHLNKVGFVGLWEIGILLALLRLWSGSLWPSMLCHAANNALAGTAFLLGWEDPAVPPPRLLLAAGALLLIIGLVVAIRLIRRLHRRDAEEAETLQPRVRRDPLQTVTLIAIWMAAVGLGIATAARAIAPFPMSVWMLLSGAAAVLAVTPRLRSGAA
jgi:membrane protease YdiL (CAAX protease family)